MKYKLISTIILSLLSLTIIANETIAAKVKNKVSLTSESNSNNACTNDFNAINDQMKKYGSVTMSTLCLGETNLVISGGDQNLFRNPQQVSSNKYNCEATCNTSPHFPPTLTCHWTQGNWGRTLGCKKQ